MNGLPYIKRYFDFSPFVQLLDERFNEIPKNNVELEVGEACSTVGTLITQPHSMPQLAGLLDVVFNSCREIYPLMTKANCFDYITRSWMNQHKKTGQTTEHRHEGVELVFSCYVNVPENSGFFELEYDSQWHTIPVKSNDILIFPGRLMHRTQVNNSNESRIVITLNITENLQSSMLTMGRQFEFNPSDVITLQEHFIKMMTKIVDRSKDIEKQLIGME